MLSTPSLWKRPVELGHAARQWRGRNISNPNLARIAKGLLATPSCVPDSGRRGSFAGSQIRTKLNRTKNDEYRKHRHRVAVASLSVRNQPDQTWGVSPLDMHLHFTRPMAKPLHMARQGLGRLIHHICQRTCDPTLSVHSVTPTSFGLVDENVGCCSKTTMTWLF